MHIQYLRVGKPVGHAICPETGTIETGQAFVGAKPQQAASVLQAAVHQVAWQTVANAVMQVSGRLGREYVEPEPA